LFLDLFIAVVFLLAVFVGFQRGVIQPLLAEVGFLGTLVALLRYRAAYAAALERYLHTDTPVLPVVLGVALAIVLGWAGAWVGLRIHRMPVVRGFDGFVGIFVHAILAFVFLYLVVSALVVADHAFTPFETATKLTLAQVDQLRRTLEENPITGALGDTQSIKDLQAQAKSGGATLSSAPQLKAAELFYDDFLQPQLRQSKLAPYVLSVGSHIPVLGHVKPSDLPRALPSPAPSPAPTPTPRR
jgi:uncharacterized membrane protein required for colicin V production